MLLYSPARAGSTSALCPVNRLVAPAVLRCKRAGSQSFSNMPRIELPLADTAGSAVARANAERATCAPIDWRQLSHELRTPLNAILGNTELLLDGSSGPLSAQARTCLGEVQAAGQRLLRQVELLLAWSELCASRPKLAECQVDLIKLVRAALTTRRTDAAQVEPPDARLLICGDRVWLEVLVAEIVALNGPHVAAPTVRLESPAGHRALRFAWSGFCVARTGALQIALIETIARLQGAEVALDPDGLSLLWPLQPPDRPEAIGLTHDPGERSRETA
jgi:His Kinase A (phospho-acceptor) domain